jgi:ATP-dependent RNA helicase DOB1
LILADLKKLEAEYNSFTIPEEDSVASYYKIRQQLDNLGKELNAFITKPQYILPFLQPGRLVKVCHCKVFYCFLY